MEELAHLRFCEFVKDFKFVYLNTPPVKAYTLYLYKAEQTISDETREGTQKNGPYIYFFSLLTRTNFKNH